MYLDLDNVPFYIGKGKGRRYRDILGHINMTHMNRLLKNKIRKVGVANVKIQFLHKDLIEKEAFQWEKYWIKYIGRRDLKEGTLCNLTNGGDGCAGHSHSEKTKRKMSKAHKGQVAWNKGIPFSTEAKRKMCKAQKEKGNPFKGKKHSEESRKKMSNALKGNIPWNKGKSQSKETRQKISETLRRKNLSCLS